MKYKSLTIDHGALSYLDVALIEAKWFENFDIPQGAHELRRVVINNHVFILSSVASIDSKYVVINNKVLNGGEAALFRRIIRVGMRKFDRNISLPVQWQPFYEGALLSIYARPERKPGGARVHFDQSPQGSENLYVYAVTETTLAFSDVDEDIKVYDESLEGIVDALLCEEEAHQDVGNYGILLTGNDDIESAYFGTLDEWYNYKLNDEQKLFVDKGYDAPIRLRGVAGTGKTQAMAVKCLRDLYHDADNGNEKIFAFLTHSSALAHDRVRRIFRSLDSSNRWSSLTSSAGEAKLWIGTLYEFSQEKLGYETKGLTPLSLDGKDGRELQGMLIRDSIDEVIRNPMVVLRFLKESTYSDILSGSAPIPDSFVDEVQNEFSCVLDAENIRRGTPESDRYVKVKRDSWQMPLPKESDRRLILEIYESYRKRLKEENLLSMDQMIADFSRYLTTYEWERLRVNIGFDAIFVDEYHYFNRNEAMTLQGMFAPRANNNGRWPLFMAYDLKQSTTDVSLDGGIERFRNPGVGASVPIDLEQVYRSTPELTSFLADLDASFPALDLEGEYTQYSGRSVKEAGESPVLRVFDSNTRLIDDVIRKASSLSKKVDGGGRQVAILCSNEEMFSAYSSAGRVKDNVVTVMSRDDMHELRYAKSRCVFSMPEYVAGLQFHTVFLINFDKVDLDDLKLSANVKRRYISRAYLGASRCSQNLFICCSEERGGVNDIFDSPLRNGSLVKE